jgi:hypothetical protein
VFEWIMQSPIPILVIDALPVRKGGGSLSEDSSDSFEVHFDPNYSEYDLMANRQYKETKYSQELKLATSPVSNVFMHYRYHMESYKTLINYAQTHPKANEYLKESMKDSIAKMVRFTTESGMADCAAIGNTKRKHIHNQTQVTPCHGCSTKNCFLPPRYTKEEKIQLVKEQG